MAMREPKSKYPPRREGEGMKEEVRASRDGVSGRTQGNIPHAEGHLKGLRVSTPFVLCENIQRWSPHNEK